MTCKTPTSGAKGRHTPMTIIHNTPFSRAWDAIDCAIKVNCKVHAMHTARWNYSHDSRLWNDFPKWQQNVELNWIERQLSNRFPVNLCIALAHCWFCHRLILVDSICMVQPVPGNNINNCQSPCETSILYAKNGSHRSSRDGSYRGPRFSVNLCRLLVHWWFSYCLVLVESSISFMVSLVPWSNHTVVKFPVNRASYMKNTVKPLI